MVNVHEHVKNLVKFSPLFIQEKAPLEDVLTLMRESGCEKIAVLKEDFTIAGFADKKTVFKYININADKKDLKSLKISDVMTHSKTAILLYPGTRVSDAYSLMTTIKMDFLPVVNSPWEKKLVGFLWLKDIIKVLDKDLLKVSV